MIEAQHINSHVQPSWMQQNPFTAAFRTSSDDLASEPFYNFAPQLLFSGWQAEAADGDAAMTMDSMATDSPVQASMDRVYHRRAPSNSTIASSYGSNSPYPQAAGLPYSAPSTTFDNALNFDSSAAFERQPQHHGFSTFSKQGHLPTPSHTPTQDTFSLESQQKPFGSDGTYRPRQQPRSSVMPAHDLPQTPQTSAGAEDSHTYNGLTTAMNGGVNVPKFNRTMSDVYQDELYDPSAYTATQPIIQQTRQHGSRQPQLLSPYNRRNMLSERLQAANDFRASMSPPGTDLRRKSPFRESSSYALASRQYGPVSGEQQTSSPMSWNSNSDETEKTISPKDAVLDYHEPTNNGTPPSLFPETPDPQPHFSNTAFQIPTSSFEFQPPSMPASVQQGLQRPQPYRTQSNASTISNFPTDDYPAHLIHMETSRSEPDGAGSSHEISRASSVYSISDVERPPRSTADSGTYTCTYHGCTQRFATPALLQKHKREGHRAAATALKTQSSLRGGSRPRSLSPATSGVDLASAATSSPRNTSSPNSPHPPIAPAPTSQSPSQLHPSQMSQHGPHRCDRINPSTGKPCNTVFSRPYDLTRHEDTIHARRTKVRCQYCVEEKTFSRSDALTRHMRVVHPEIVAAMGGENARRRGRGRKTGGD